LFVNKFLLLYELFLSLLEIRFSEMKVACWDMNCSDCWRNATGSLYFSEVMLHAERLMLEKQLAADDQRKSAGQLGLPITDNRVTA